MHFSPNYSRSLNLHDWWLWRSVTSTVVTMQISQGVNICCSWDFIVCELSDYCYWFLYRQMVCQITFWHTTLETCGSVDIYKRDKFFIKNTQRYKLFKQLKCNLFSCKLRLNFPEGKGCVQKEAKQYCNQEQLDSSKFPNFTVCKYFHARKM